MKDKSYETSVECPICEGYETEMIRSIPLHKRIEIEYCCYNCNVNFAKVEYDKE